MTRETLLALADRVEGLAGPDREVDQAVYYDALGYCRHARKERSGAQSDIGFDCMDCGADSWGNLGSKGQRLHDAAPTYTASLDAAMGLVPEGRDWMLDNFDGPVGKRCTASVFNEYGAAYADYDANASTPALAICAASLRARAAMEGGE